MNRDLSKANFIATRSALAELDLLSTKTTTTKQDETRIRFLLAKVAALRSGYDVDELNRADLLAATPDAPYGDPDAEYRRTLAGSGLFDTSHAAKLELTGPDAPMFPSAEPAPTPPPRKLLGAVGSPATPSWK